MRGLLVLYWEVGSRIMILKVLVHAATAMGEEGVGWSDTNQSAASRDDPWMQKSSARPVVWGITLPPACVSPPCPGGAGVDGLVAGGAFASLLGADMEIKTTVLLKHI